jgi:hypothetical protein
VATGSEDVPPRPTKSRSGGSDDGTPPRPSSGRSGKQSGAQRSGGKVAKAARAGKGAKVQRQESLLFPLSVLGVILAGLILVVYARSTRGEENTTRPRVEREFWTSAYGVYTCDTFLPPLPSEAVGVDLGIGESGRGTIEIFPTNDLAAGRNATLQRFFDATGMLVSDDAVTLPAAAGGIVYTNGSDPGCGAEGETVEAEWRLARWGNVDSDEPDVTTSGFGDERFFANGELFTLAYVPVDFDDDDIPKPPAERVAELGGTAVTTTTVAADGETTTTGPTTTSDTAGPTTTAAAEGDTTTTAG